MAAQIFRELGQMCGAALTPRAFSSSMAGASFRAVSAMGRTPGAGNSFKSLSLMRVVTMTRPGLSAAARAAAGPSFVFQHAGDAGAIVLAAAVAPRRILQRFHAVEEQQRAVRADQAGERGPFSAGERSSLRTSVRWASSISLRVGVRPAALRASASAASRS